MDLNEKILITSMSCFEIKVNLSIQLIRIYCKDSCYTAFLHTQVFQRYFNIYINQIFEFIHSNLFQIKKYF